MIDLLVFRARVHLSEFSFKLLHCYMYFVICSLQKTHFYCMFPSEFPALHNTCTHPAQFVSVILPLNSLKAKKVKPLQQKYEHPRKLNYRYTSIPSVLSSAKKLNLLLKHRNCGHVTDWSCVEYSVWGQSRGVV